VFVEQYDPGWSATVDGKTAPPRLAVAADPVDDGNNIDYLASLAYNNKYKANLNKLFDRFSFFIQTSSLSYIYAGSFSKYLIKKYGINKFEKF